MISSTTRRFAAFPLALVALVALGACGSDDAETEMDAPATEAQVETSMEDLMESDTALPVSQLGGSSWELVMMRAADGSEFMPEDASQYGLTFTEDGTGVSIQADCNRATGGFTSDEPGLITFGNMPMTQMMCEEGSYGSPFAARFSDVRRYAMDEGRLYLAGETGGPIMEFRPVI